MILTCIGACLWFFYRKKYPTYAYRGHIPNFTIPDRISRAGVPSVRLLRRLFPRVIVGDEDATTGEQLQEVVGGEAIPQNVDPTDTAAEVAEPTTP